MAYSTGIGDVCEIEGRGYEPSDKVCCSRVRRRVALISGRAVVFRWSLVSHALSPRLVLFRRWRSKNISERNHFIRPASFDTHSAAPTSSSPPERDSRNRRDGEIVGAADLKRSRHRHPEGIAIYRGESGDFRLLIGDEGEDRQARITSYRLRDVGDPPRPARVASRVCLPAAVEAPLDQARR